MAQRNRYEVDVNGVKHTMLLDEEDVKRYGKRAKRVTTKEAAAPQNKAGQPAGGDKSGSED